MTNYGVIGRRPWILAAMFALPLGEAPWQFVDVVSVQASVRLAGRVNVPLLQMGNSNRVSAIGLPTRVGQEYETAEG